MKKQITITNREISYNTINTILLNNNKIVIVTDCHCLGCPYQSHQTTWKKNVYLEHKDIVSRPCQ